MPELPEVETTRRGITPYLLGKKIQKVDIYQPKLRWPIPKEVLLLEGALVTNISRRGKYILIHTALGTAILHLGMSGSLRIANPSEPRRKHDHIEIHINKKRVLRFHDPRRFGCMLWQNPNDAEHSLLAHLGPEPLSDAFDDSYLFNASRKRKVAIKLLIMNSQIVVGVGNIYASEALFEAGIRPGCASHRITKKQATNLSRAIKIILQRSIDQGGTTLKDFVNSEGQPGYFQQTLSVYGREGEPCKQCGAVIKQKVMGQRSTFYCPTCQS